MGKKKNNESNQQKQPPLQQNEQQPPQQNEGKFLLGKPKFKKLENGRYKCVQTGHELPADARETYSQTKHCRLGLIDSALARNKPPLNMFNQDPLCRSKLICKLTGHTVNKSEEHIWKHITGKRFLNMLEKQEAEKEASNGLVEEGEQKPEKASTSEGDGLKKKKKKKEKKKNKKKMEEENDVSKIISEVRNPEEKDGDTEEEEFWMPPEGDRWDFDDRKDCWGSDIESDVDPEGDDDDDDAIEADVIIEDSKDTQELSKRTKRMSIELEPSDSTSKKKKKIQST